MGKGSGISDEQRLALRKWYYQQDFRPSQKHCIEWFTTQYQRQLRQSTVSETLSNRWKHLDSEQPTSSRQQSGQWPILEAVLHDWQLLVEARGGSTSTELLLNKAREVWPQIPSYASHKTPEFSNGWMARFKKRHGIKRNIQHGEAASVPAAAEGAMEPIRELCRPYPDEDIYNMDETGCYWRIAPSAGLTTHPMPGAKKDKARISLVHCCNASGSDKFKLWVIGHAKQPHALRGVNLAALNLVWTSNKKAWMTGLIMKDWLCDFYAHVNNRDVVLLIDNFSGHTTGLELAPPPPNVKIQFLPPNATSRYQPLDQGIIASFKAHYKRQWLQFIAQGLEKEVNPYSMVTLYHGLRWCSKAWRLDVTPETIQNCFRKSTIVGSEASTTTSEVPTAGIETLYNQIRDSSQIRNMMSLINFLNPEGEDWGEQQEEDALQQALQRHVPSIIEDEEEALAEQEGEDVVVPSTKEAVEAIRILLRYREHEESSTESEITFLQRLQRSIYSASITASKQTRIESYFSAS